MRFSIVPSRFQTGQNDDTQSCFAHVGDFCQCGLSCTWNGDTPEKCFAPSNYPLSVLQQHVYPFLLDPLTKWDAARFLRLALHPQLAQPHPVDDKDESEQAHAFFPLFPMAIQLVARFLMIVVPQSFLPSTCAGVLVLSAVSLNTICFILALVSLYKLTYLLLLRHSGSADETSCRRHANLVVVLFGINPASVFFITAYSESLFAALIFTGSYWMALWGPFGAVIPFTLASTTRSNGMLYSGYLLLYGAGQAFQLKQNLLRRFVRPLMSLLVGLAILFPLYRHNQLAFWAHCERDTETAARFEWCAPPNSASNFYLYSYIQRKHWNVGFLRYYELKQIPNFLLATPILILSVTGVVHWLQESWRHVTSADDKPLLYQCYTWVVESLRQFANPPHGTSTDNVCLGRPVLGHYAVWAVATFLGITLAHVQISTRLLCSTCPALYWYAAHVVKTSERWGSLYLGYCLLYIVLGCTLHPLFLPWT